MPSTWVYSFHWVYAFHALFYATFLPRLIARRLAPRPAAPPAQAPAETARFSRALVGIHGFAMFVLYLGVGASAFGGSRRMLFTPQPAAGAAVIVAAAALAAWALSVFSSWRLRAHVESGHQLSTTGPFRYVRNPIYLGMCLLAAGTFLWIPHPLVLAGMLLVFLGADLRARAEEKVLLAAFGEPYREYRARVKRFVPGVY